MRALLIFIAIVLALVGSTRALENELEKLIQSHQQMRRTMDQGELALAEEFGRQVATGRYALKPYFRTFLDEATLAPIQEFTSKIEQLRLVSDADAAIEALKKSMGAEEAARALASEPEARGVVESTLVPACEGYMLAMMRVINAAELAAMKASLDEQVKGRPHDRQVKDFLLGWAHYHTCRLLAMGDRTELIHRIPTRVDDARRIAAKKAAKLRAQQELLL